MPSGRCRMHGRKAGGRTSTAAIQRQLLPSGDGYAPSLRALRELNGKGLHQPAHP